MLIITYRADDSQEENSGSMNGGLISIRSVMATTLKIRVDLRSLGLQNIIDLFDDVYAQPVTHLKTYQSHNHIEKIFDVYARSEIDHAMKAAFTSHQSVH